MTTAPRTPFATRIASLGLALLLTLATLAGVDTLATGDAAAPQMAQRASTTA